MSINFFSLVLPLKWHAGVDVDPRVANEAFTDYISIHISDKNI